MFQSYNAEHSKVSVKEEKTDKSDFLKRSKAQKEPENIF